MADKRPFAFTRPKGQRLILFLGRNDFGITPGN